MLKTAFILTVALTLALPVVLYSSLPPAKRKDGEWAREQVNRILHEGGRLDRIKVSAMLDLCRAPTGQVPPSLAASMPEWLDRWAEEQDRRTIDTMFEDLFRIMKRDFSSTWDAYWLALTRAMNGDLFLRSLDLTLKHERLEAVEACLDLPGYSFFISQLQIESPLQSFMLSYRKKWNNPAGAYGGRPWLMVLHGEDIIHRIAGIEDLHFKQNVLRELNRSLDKYKKGNLCPWLPLAYFTLYPEAAYSYSLEAYLHRVLNEKSCPYLLNAAALYLHTIPEYQLMNLMENLRPHGDKVRKLSLEEDNLGDPGFLYWLFHSAASTFRSPEDLESIRSLEAPGAARPGGMEYLERMWSLSTLDGEGGFFRFMQGLEKHNPAGVWPDPEITRTLQIQGHCFMDL
jgi:hypothetical protein